MNRVVPATSTITTSPVSKSVVNAVFVPVIVLLPFGKAIVPLPCTISLLDSPNLFRKV